MTKFLNGFTLCFVLMLLFGCQQKIDEKKQPNEELFDYLMASIFEREAFSPSKIKNLNIDLEKQLLDRKTSFLKAKTDEDLYFEILKLSNLRRDSHLKLRPKFIENDEEMIFTFKVQHCF